MTNENSDRQELLDKIEAMNTDAQAVFDKAIQGILDQGSLSAVGTIGCCQYRDQKGNKCVAGIILPDEEYDPDMEARRVDEIPFFLDNFSPKIVIILAELQTKIHDWVATLHVGCEDSPEALGKFLDGAEETADTYHLEWNFAEEREELRQLEKKKD